mgnify:CR=1 FL=1|tara:strand:+ start:1280 stop:1480 length:201 start_codon:yes stop_codon:yes gene_type:complete
MEFVKGDEVWIRDFPFGKPLNVKGTIVGKIGKDSYNVLMQSGLLEGNIIKYKYWKLYSFDSEEQLV